MPAAACRKLQEIGFPSSNVIGGELRVEDKKIAGSSLIINAELKGYVIEQLGHGRKTVAVGHSSGDRYMLEHADLGLSYQNQELGDTTVTSSAEIEQAIENFLS